MSAPPPYPRVAHLVSGREASDARVLAPAELDVLLSRQVVVEEKLDGANVVAWLDAGRLEVALRSGPGAMDRAKQLGRLRAWAAQHDQVLRGALDGNLALYGEWLWLSHAIAYDRLPSYLVGLDLLSPDRTFLGVDARDRRCDRLGLARPPELWRGVAGSVDCIESLCRQSQYASARAEGVVVRTVDGQHPRIAKLLAPTFAPLDDAAWSAQRPRNRLADQERVWR